MSDVLTRARDRRRSALACEVERWLVYGAGSTGRKWAQTLADSGRSVHGFIDRQAVSAGGLPIFKPTECPVALKRECAVLVAIHNPGVSVAEVRSSLVEQGYENIYLLQDLVDTWPERSHFWLAPAAESLSHEADIAAACDSLADAPSRELFVALLDQRLNAQPERLPIPDSIRTYIPLDLPPLPSPLRFIDCGAYAGDTIGNLKQHGLHFERIAAFEPDPQHYPALCAVLASEQAIAVPCGVWDSATQLRFVANDAASHIAEAGDTMVRTVTLDDALPNFRPNFLKMDIEGAESAALRGAQRMIAANRPRLAISAYHRPRDLWELLAMIEQWDLGYQFHLRLHSHNGFDTVLYGLPQ